MFNFFHKNKDSLEKRLEENEKICLELKEREKMFRTLLDTTPLCIKWFDKNGDLISINKNGREEHFLTDKTDEEIKKWNYFECIEKRYHQKIKDAMKLALEKGESSSFEIEHVAGTSKGEWCQSSFEPVKNEKGKVEYVLFLSRDVTYEKTKEGERQDYLKKIEDTKNALYNILEDSKESERRAQEESDYSKAIISSMGEGLLIINKDYKISLLNNKAQDLLGVSVDNAIGRNVKNIITTLKGDILLDEKDIPVVKMFETGQTIYANIEDNIYFQTSADKRFPVGLAITPLVENGVTSAVVIFWDLTEEKDLDKAKNSFISIVSHQLRTPLTTLRWVSELFLSGDIGKLTDKQVGFMEDLHKGSVRLLDLIGALLAISRLEAGRVNIETEMTDVKSITDEILEQLKNLANKKHLKVNFIADPKLPKIKLGTEFLRQAILNLISNSLNYTPDGGKIDISLKKEIVGDKEQAIFMIKDNGIGIPKNAQSKIFEKFHRADNAVSTVPSGTGLGLNLARSVVEMWNGKIWFESEEGKGTTFYFTIPLSGMQSKKGEVGLLS